MRQIYTNQSIAMAGLVRATLDQYGISSQLRNEYTSGVMGDLPFASVWPEVWVADQDVSRALELVAEFEANTSDESAERVQADWQCPACQESNPGNFASCWQCSESRSA